MHGTLRLACSACFTLLPCRLLPLSLSAAAADNAAKTGQALIAHPIFNLLPDVEEGMDVDSVAATPAPAPAAEASTSATTTTAAAAPSQPKKYTAPIDQTTSDLIPEAIVYLRLLIILAALDAGKVAEAADFALETANFVQQANRRTMDQIAAKIYFYLARAYELQDRLAELRPCFNDHASCCGACFLLLFY